MAMNGSVLEMAIKGAVLAELQNQFLSEVPPEHQQAVTDQHDLAAVCHRSPSDSARTSRRHGASRGRAARRIGGDDPVTPPRAIPRAVGIPVGSRKPMV